MLVNGASGGVGTFAVQLASSMGMQVTAVCSGRNAELVGSLGAGFVIDYAREDFCERGERYSELSGLVESGSIVPVVDRTFAFDDAVEAMR